MLEKFISAKNAFINLIVRFLYALQKIIFEVHIYGSFDETKFKVPMFVASFFASVYCYNKVSSQPTDSAQTNITVGCAVLLYGLSLVSEVWMLLNNEDAFLKKLFRGIIFWDGVAAIVLGVNLISSQASILSADSTIMLCAVSAFIFFVDGLLYYWVRPPETHLGSQEEQLKNMEVGRTQK